MTLYDWLDENMMDMDQDYPCYIWDNENEEEIFKGTMDEIPESILHEYYFVSLEFDPQFGLGFNVM